MTAVGPIHVRRTYFTCPHCGQGDFAADAVLGLDGYLTVGAQRMATLAGVSGSTIFLYHVPCHRGYDSLLDLVARPLVSSPAPGAIRPGARRRV